MKSTALILKKSKALALSCGLATMGITNFASAQSAVTDPVGYVSMDVQPGTVETPTRNVFSVSLAGQSVEFNGTINSVSANVVMVSDTDLEIDVYSEANGPFFLISEDGDIYDIISNNVDDITLDSSATLSGLAGKAFKIYKHQTIASVFGSEPENVLGAASFSEADNLLIFNYKTRQFDRFYYKNAALGINNVTGWVNSLNFSLADNTIIHPATGFIFIRKDVSNFKLIATGGVINSDITVNVTPGNNFLTIPYPVDKQINLANSGLYDAENHDLSRHLLGAAAAENADRIRIWNGIRYENYYYKNAPLGINPTIGWVDTLTFAPSESRTIPHGAGFIISRLENQPLRWKFTNVIPTN